jgi:glycosyltransferase involved in cell wall biosynthesis
MIVRKVLVEMEKLHNLNSGLGQFCKGLGNALSKIKSEQIDLTFLVPNHQSNIFGKTIIYHQLKRFSSFFWNKPKGFDVWHCTHQQSKYLPSAGKLIITIHDLNFLYKYNGLKRKLKLMALQHKINKAHAVVAISEFTANEIKQHLNIDESKLYVIYNGVSELSAENEELPDYLIDKKYLFSIGIINPKKNFHVLLPLLQNTPDLILVIAGNNSHAYVQSIKEKATALGISNRLYFMGAVSDGVKYQLYKNCYAFVFPSLAEGFGLPVIEAMSVGKPVFLSNLTCLPEIGGKEAFYWNSFEANHMQQIFDNGMKCYEQDLEKKARIILHASQFTWEKAAKAYLRLYQSI